MASELFLSKKPKECSIFIVYNDKFPAMLTATQVTIYSIVPCSLAHLESCLPFTFAIDQSEYCTKRVHAHYYYCSKNKINILPSNK